MEGLAAFVDKALETYRSPENQRFQQHEWHKDDDADPDIAQGIAAEKLSFHVAFFGQANEVGIRGFHADSFQQSQLARE